MRLRRAVEIRISIDCSPATVVTSQRRFCGQQMLSLPTSLWAEMAIMSGYFSDAAKAAFMVLRHLRHRAVRRRKSRVSIYIERGVLRCRHAGPFTGV